MQTPRSQQPMMSPSLRRTGISVATGGGQSAAEFLKRQVSEAPSSSTSWSCQESWASGEFPELDSPKLLDVQEVVAPAFPASSPQRPNRLQMRRKSLMARLLNTENERCSCCTKEEFWTLFDVFACMDRRHQGAIRRGDFVWALGAHGASVEFQKVLRKSRLFAYFKSTAQDISFGEFVNRIFPNSNAMEKKMDTQKMQRWVSLRKARNLLTNPEFRGSCEELTQVFNLLQVDCIGTICANELLRADILSHAEVLAILPLSGEVQMGFDDFQDIVTPVLLSKFEAEGVDDDSGKENDWQESVMNEVKDKFNSVKAPFGFPFATNKEGGEHPFLPAPTSKTDSVLAVAAAPLPPGTVATLISRLTPTKTRRLQGDSASRAHWCKTEMDIPQMLGSEASLVVPAF